MRILPSYFYYFFKAKKRHGLHSPFVYELMDKCMAQKLEGEDKQVVLDYCNQLKSNKEVIKIQDFGVGSKKMGNERVVKSIFKYSSTHKKYGNVLYKLVKYYKPKNILELGTSLGVGTLYLHLGYKEAIIDTVEGCVNTHNFTKKKLQNIIQSKVNFHHSRFTPFLENLGTKKYDLIYIDGNHKQKALFEQLSLLKNHFHNNTFIVIDDIRWSTDMLEAWKKLMKNNDFNVSLDFGRMGIILPRKHQQKEHFYLKV